MFIGIMAPGAPGLVDCNQSLCSKSYRSARSLIPLEAPGEGSKVCAVRGAGRDDTGSCVETCFSMRKKMVTKA